VTGEGCGEHKKGRQKIFKSFGDLVENDSIKTIIMRRNEMSPARSLLVGISGIDAGGKGFIAAKLADMLAQKGFRIANINVDGWLNLPPVRFSQDDPAAIFMKRRFALPKCSSN
jgi:signal recognition particle GTPase